MDGLEKMNECPRDLSNTHAQSEYQFESESESESGLSTVTDQFVVCRLSD